MGKLLLLPEMQILADNNKTSASSLNALNLRCQFGLEALGFTA